MMASFCPTNAPVQPFLIGEGWTEVLGGNDTARALFQRHYSCRPNRSRQANGSEKLIIGPGEKLVLLTADAGALCAWRREKHRLDGQVGVNCTVFRRESGDIASELLVAAMALAWARFPGERLFTFVDPAKVKPAFTKGGLPLWGVCFYRAGWRFAGLTKKRLHVLDIMPEAI